MRGDQVSSILEMQKWFDIRNSINIIQYVNRVKGRKPFEYLSRC